MTTDCLAHELKLWQRDMKLEDKTVLENVQSFISFPFTLSPATKAVILEEDAQIQMNRGFHYLN